MPHAHVLDSSALIAVLFEESGADKVEQHLSGALVSSVNLTEVIAGMMRYGNAPRETQKILQTMAISVADYDEAQAVIAAEILPLTKSKGLSLGDRACLALAISRKAPVLTADRAWRDLSVGISITVIR